MTTNGFGSTTNIVILTYEFTFSPFSGNGILSRSLVKALLLHGCQVTVWCCRPSAAHQHKNHALQTPEITPDQEKRLIVVTADLKDSEGWRRLDRESAWEAFHWARLKESQKLELNKALKQTDAVLVIDWTGACAWRSIADIWTTTTENRKQPFIYLNFRVYSSGILDPNEHEWYDAMERRAAEDADLIIALSENDKASLQKIMEGSSDDKKDIRVLPPPLRGDMEALAKLPYSELAHSLPLEASKRLSKSTTQRCLVSCLVRLSPEKNTMRFVEFVKATHEVLQQQKFIPLLVGASSDSGYAREVKEKLRDAFPESIIVDSFLPPASLAAILSRTVLNFHPCAYDAYGMTIIEAAALGVPSVIAAGGHVGAVAIVKSDGCIQVEMPNSSDLSIESVQVSQTILKNTEDLQTFGERARLRALSWDEAAYGKELLSCVNGLKR